MSKGGNGVKVEADAPVTTETLKEIVQSIGEDVLLADGFDDALVGVVTVAGNEVALYDTAACLAKLINDGMTEEEAMEHFEFNVIGSYVGPKTPAFGMIYRRIYFGTPEAQTKTVSK
jgi:hypothetical protein